MKPLMLTKDPISKRSKDSLGRWKTLPDFVGWDNGNYRPGDRVAYFSEGRRVFGTVMSPDAVNQHTGGCVNLKSLYEYGYVWVRGPISNQGLSLSTDQCGDVVMALGAGTLARATWED